jgi:hypothetical protein
MLALEDIEEPREARGNRGAPKENDLTHYTVVPSREVRGKKRTRAGPGTDGGLVIWTIFVVDSTSGGLRIREGGGRT